MTLFFFNITVGCDTVDQEGTSRWAAPGEGSPGSDVLHRVQPSKSRESLTSLLFSSLVRSRRVCLGSVQNPRSRVDRFRGRLVVPIRDHRGTVIGFGARDLSDSQVCELNRGFGCRLSRPLARCAACGRALTSRLLLGWDKGGVGRGGEGRKPIRPSRALHERISPERFVRGAWCTCWNPGSWAEWRPSDPARRRVLFRSSLRRENALLSSM